MILFWKNHNRLKISTMYEVHSTYVLTKYLLKMYFAHWIYFWNSNLNFHDFFYQLKKKVYKYYLVYFWFFLSQTILWKIQESQMQLDLVVESGEQENRPQYES